MSSQSQTLENDNPHAAQEQSSQLKDVPDKAQEEADERPEVNSTKETAFATPLTDRPTRERKTVERYTISSPHKFPGYSTFKALSIEKGHGKQLKDIPNVAFKLSKRKTDDNLRTLHNILFGRKGKAHNLKKNIGLFSGYVWTENEEKERAKIREKIDKCVKEKLVDFCNLLNIPINKASMKKEELSAKLLEFLESPHATTDVLLADKEKKGKKRGRKEKPRKSSGEGSETPAKKQTSQAAGKKRKQSSDVEDDDTSEPSDAEVDSQEDDVSVPKSESDHEEVKSEDEEDNQQANRSTSKKTFKEDDQPTPVKTAKSNEKTPKKSASKKAVTVTDSTIKSKQSASKKQKTRENQNSKEKVANKKQGDKSSKALVKDQGKGIKSEKAKAEPSRKEMHEVVVDILKEVDFNKATLSDILRQLGTHFNLDLMHRKAEVKDIITDVINSMSDDDGEEADNAEDDDADKNDV
ncbi:hypothetical protein Fmac_004083 [Flemingia macrophylla]|uniref:DEK-C domain-containing protein n=1 Tax=Flemingia macrophylla TaxID=520843 RepID=A0ABD1N5A8_9FABA